jgi:Tol biopolymer transport system component
LSNGIAQIGGIVKPKILSLFLILAFVMPGQAQPCDEVLAFEEVIDSEGIWQALTICTTNTEPRVLARPLTNQRVRLEAWSSTANAIAYTDAGLASGLYVVGENYPTRRLLLSNTEALTYSQPHWSPDGTQMIALEQGNDALWIVLVDLQGNVQRIANVADEGSLHSSPVWSPSGEWIAYTEARFLKGASEINIELLSTDCIADPTHTCEAHTLEITDSSGERPLLVLDDGHAMLEVWRNPAWSPDGEQVAFVCGEDLCFLNADGTDFRRSSFEFSGYDLAWSASGSYLAYTFENDIYVYDMIQETYTNITRTERITEWLPIWIPLPEGEFLFEAE